MHHWVAVSDLQGRLLTSRTCRASWWPVTAAFTKSSWVSSSEYLLIPSSRYPTKTVTLMSVILSSVSAACWHKPWKQVNTGAAEVLYSAVGEWAQLDEDSTVLDVCCGTGTIGISLAKVTKFSGSSVCTAKILKAFFLSPFLMSFLPFSEWRRWLELSCVRRQWRTPKLTHNLTVSQQKIWNCHVLIKVLIHQWFVLEGLTNVEFHCGKAEDVFPNILNAVVSSNVTAIVDPPRAGLRESESTKTWTLLRSGMLLI